MKRAGSVVLIIAAGTAAAGASAQAPAASQETRNAIVSSVSQCRSLIDEAARLACYDRAAAALDEAVEQNQIVVLDREAVRETRRSLFGFSLPRLRLFSNEDGMEDEGEITATVESAVPLGYGKWQIRIEGGALWQTTELTRTEPSRGDTVRIRRAALGSYFINIRSGRAVRARRVG